jgi:hypothetical protein
MHLRCRLGITAVVGSLLLLVAGCGDTGGADGDLTNQWAVIGAPTGFEPKTGTCHLSGFTEAGPRATYEEVDCAQNHRTETTYIGTYASPAADADAPPAAGSNGARDAYKVCDQKTTDYVGGPWRTARLWIGVTHPSAAAWSGGARWFRCEVVEISSIEDDGGLQERTGSLKDALAESASPLLLTCYAIKLDASGAIDTMPATACTTTHNAEFVGIWTAGAIAYPEKDAQWVPFHDGCRKLIATYAKLPDDSDLQYRTGVVSLPGGDDVWAQGDHGVRCYLWLDGASLTTSLKGAGVAKMPIQYK